MKKYILIILLSILCLIFTGCNGRWFNYPIIRIERNNKVSGDVIIPIRENYTFSEDLYSIEEVENGYNIIISCIKGGN